MGAHFRKNDLYSHLPTLILMHIAFSRQAVESGAQEQTKKANGQGAVGQALTPKTAEGECLLDSDFCFETSFSEADSSVLSVCRNLCICEFACRKESESVFVFPTGMLQVVPGSFIIFSMYAFPPHLTMLRDCLQVRVDMTAHWGS